MLKFCINKYMSFLIKILSKIYENLILFIISIIFIAIVIYSIAVILEAKNINPFLYFNF